MQAPRSPWQLLTICFGSFGVQFGWALQTANVSAIYEFLGARPDMLPLLWLAGPISCLIVQPLIGYASDRTWIPGLGRRRPYFLGGALLCSLALIALPNASALWMAAGALWILDASLHVTIEPYRAFIADLVPPEQRAQGFALQSFLVGLGAIVAASLPWWIARFWPEALQAPTGSIPANVKIAFYLGAAIFSGSILITVLTNREPLPCDRRPTGMSWRGACHEITTAWRNLPPVGRRLLWVQLASWMGVYCVFLFFAPAMGHQIFGAESEQSPQYAAGIAWAGVAIATYNLTCMATSLLLPRLVRALGAAKAHALCLLLGGLGIIALAVVRDRYWLLLPLSGFGAAWASILTIPYTLLAAAVPLENLGLFVGIFNAFIALPQLLVSLGMGWVLRTFLGNNQLWATILGGGFLILGAIAALNLQVAEPATRDRPQLQEVVGR